VKKGAAVLVSLLLMGAAVRAQSADEFVKQAVRAQGQKQLVQAAALYEKAFAAGSDDASAAYDAACCFALGGERDKAFVFLNKAGEYGWQNADHARKNADLDSLRADPRWEPALALFDGNAKRAQVLWASSAWRSPYAQELSEEARIAGLSRLWSEVKYNFSFPEKLAALDWDALYIGFIPRVRAVRSTVEYYQVLQELMAKLQDGHTNVIMPQEYWRTWAGRPGLQTRLIEGRVLVHKLWDPELGKQGLVPGLEIVKIDGLPTRQYAEEFVSPRESSSTPQYLDILTYERSLLTGAFSDPVKLTLAAEDGRTMERTVPRLSFPELTKLAPNPRPAPFEFRMLAGNTAYVALNSFMNDATADEFFKRFAEIAVSEALILDLRENGGGNTNVGYRIMAALAKEPFLGSRWSTRDYKPAFRSWGRPDRLYVEAAEREPVDPDHRYAGQVVVLTSPRTFSAAEDFLVAFDQSGRGTIIGEPSGGSTGNPLQFSLPGGGTGLVCSKHDAYADGREFVGIGIKPQIAVSPTVADYRVGKDTVLERALTEIGKSLSRKQEKSE
jgi:carboxyl-terminal processing protease